MSNYKKLYRSMTNKKLCGVCGGIAEYFEIDPSVVRILWIIFACFGGGLLAYLICALFIPNQNQLRNFRIVKNKHICNNNKRPPNTVFVILSEAIVQWLITNLAR